MKRNILYLLIAFITLTFVACEDNVDDAVSKHVYGEDENPYLRADVNARIAPTVEFEIGRFAPIVIKLDDYAEIFQEEMGMTVDQVISGVKDGSVVFYNINVSRNVWDKTAPTNGSTGWYYNSAGGISTSVDYKAILDFDMNAKTISLNIHPDAKAGDMLSFNVGFAINGDNYDKYARFAFDVAVTDPSLIITTVSIPAGDYANAPIDLTKYADIIEYNMKMSLDEFLAALDANEGGTIHMYVIDTENEAWDDTSSYTGNAPGYWMNNLGQVCAWNTEGFSLFAETWIADKKLAIGRAPGINAGTTFKIGIGYKDTEAEDRFFRIIITATLE
ncbi:MAG: DUF4859 domain-containing protein [Prolixibacteraceae bacterium]|nr:DUF4859 domain-containing protein [Prolixibacteraceae bacterium]